ncbi:MAG: type II secretion system protein GspG, partial [Kiritimatiellae bacterium]|nr:type II secretion system protein GspG [Kiritimatiellia bacterium]
MPNALVELTVGSENQSALLTGVSIRDAWGQPFLYRKSGGINFVLRSCGPDRRMGTTGDIL